MTAGGCHFQRTAREQLTAHVGEIGHCAGRRGRKGGRGSMGRRGCNRRTGGTSRERRTKGGGVVQRADGFDERRHGHDVDAFDNRGFGGVGCRQQQPGETIAARGDGDGQHAARRLNRSVERQLAEQNEVGDVASLDDAARREDAERDRQVERRARLSHVGRRQIDDDSVRRKVEPRVPDRRLHAVAALTHARVGQPDHRERRKTERHVDFDVHGTGVETEQRRRSETGQHRPTRCKTRLNTARIGISSIWRESRIRS